MKICFRICFLLTLAAGNFALSFTSGDEDRVISLEEAVSLAINSGFDQAIDVQSHEAQVQQVQSSSALQLPSAKIITTYNNSFSDKKGSINDNGRASIRADIPIFDMKNLASLRAAREEIKALKSDLKRKTSDRIFRICQTYADALVARSMLLESIEKKKYFDSQLESLQRKFKLGLARKFDVVRADYEVHRAQAEIIKEQGGFNETISLLRDLINLKTSFQIRQFNIDIEYERMKPDELIKLARDNHELVYYSANVESAKYKLLSKQFSFFPKLSASIETGLNIGFNNAEDPFFRNTSFALNLEIPLFGGGSRIAAFRSAKAYHLQESLKFRQKNSFLPLQIQTVLKNIKDHNELVANAKLAYNLALEAANSAQRLFENDELTLLEINKVNVDVFAAHRVTVQAQISLELKRLKLLSAIGLIDGFFKVSI